jgi:hypothetical protein
MSTLLILLLGCSDKSSGGDGEDLLRSNVPPVVVFLELTPETPRASDELVATYDVLDIDGDEIEVWFEWTADGEVIYEDGPALPVGLALGGQAVGVEMTLADGWSYGEPGRAEVTLQNSAPQVTEVEVSPGDATATDPLTCSYTAFDSDEDPLSDHFQWYINGVADSRSDTLTGGYVRGDRVFCEVYVSDGSEISNTLASDEITIQNSPPGAPEISLDPDPGSPCTEGRVYVTADAPDVDGDSLSYDARWLDSGGTQVYSGLEYPAFTFEDGQEYTVIVTPYDGADYGSPATASFRARGGGEVLGDGLDQDCDSSVDEWHTGAWQAEVLYWDPDDGAQIGTDMGAGDLDGDGRDEIFAARPGSAELAIFLGASMDPEVPRLRSPDVLLGDASSVQDIVTGDVDGDGTAELLVGATGYDGEATNGGAAFLLSTSALRGGDLEDLDTWRIEGDESSMGLGEALALGDIDGDGLADAAVGEPLEDAPARDAGAVYLFLSPSGSDTFETAAARFEGTNREALFGSSVAIIDDINGDGYPELAAGGPGDDSGASEGGRVAIWFGGASPVDGAVDDADVNVLGDSTGDYAGAEDVDAADIDGDGLAELLVGSEDDNAGYSTPGTLSLLSGSLLAGGGTFSLAEAFAVVEATSSNAFLGLYGGGGSLVDLSGDGAAELVAGASGAGMLYVWDGEDLAAGGNLGPAEASIAIQQDNSGDQFGRWALVADTDGDGAKEFFTSAYRSSADGSTGGALFGFRPDYAEVDYWQPDCDAVDGLLFCRVALTWADARSHCQRLGGDLARLEDAGLNSDAGDGAEDRGIPGSETGRYWIGLSDQASEGTWVWLDDSEAASWTSWGSSEPHSGTDRNCAQINGAGAGRWQSHNCGDTLPFICQP